MDDKYIYEAIFRELEKSPEFKKKNSIIRDRKIK